MGDAWAAIVGAAVLILIIIGINTFWIVWELDDLRREIRQVRRQVDEIDERLTEHARISRLEAR